MKSYVWMCAAVLVVVAACGDKNNDSNDDNVIPGNVRPNNETNNGTNNSNNSNNSPTNNGPNNETNNGPNNETNNVTNNETNNVTNNATNNETNNSTLGPAETGTAIVDIAITMNARQTQMTSCAWDEATALSISYNAHPTDGTIVGRLSCQAADDMNANGVFLLEMTILDSAVGTNAATTMFVDCNQNGCSGNSEITVSYVDQTMGISDTVSTATSSNEGGNMVIGSFDTTTAELDGSLDAVINEGGLNVTLVGTFSADLADCTDRPNCVGDGM